MPNAKGVPIVPPDLQPQDLPERLSDPTANWPELQVLGTREPLRPYLRQMWGRREFATTVALGQLTATNQDTVLGRSWALLNPLLLIGVYYFIFEVALGIEERGGVDNYLAFLTVGVITYNFTRSCAQAGSSAIYRNRALVRSITMPRALLPVSAIISQGVAHLYAVGAMLAVLPLLGINPRWSWLLLIPVLMVQAMFNIGLAMFAARATFHFPDLSNFLPFLLRLVLYLSGAIIPLTPEIIANDRLRTVLQANPVYLIIDITRQSLLGDPLRGLSFAMMALWALALLTAGFAFFRRAEHRYGRD